MRGYSLTNCKTLYENYHLNFEEKNKSMWISVAKCNNDEKIIVRNNRACGFYRALQFITPIFSMKY